MVDVDEQAGEAGSASTVKMAMLQELNSHVRCGAVVKVFKGRDKRWRVFFCHFKEG